MSRSRIEAKLRSQAWYADLTAWLDREGIGYQVQPAASGHPKLLLTVPGKGQVVCSIPCTPKSNLPGSMNIGKVRRLIQNMGAPAPRPRHPRSAWTPHRIACLSRGVNPNEGLNP